MHHLDFKKILFFDIETVSQQPFFADLADNFQSQWARKSKFILRKYEEEVSSEEMAQAYEDRAAIYAEFGKIVCISMAYIAMQDDQEVLRVKSIAYDDEYKLLDEFKVILTQYFFDPKKHFLCGHNVKEFDIPYICRRMIIHGIALPEMLDITGKKPWETEYMLDTMNMWKFGDHKNFTSLDLLANSLGIQTPKDDIDGSEVGRVYWKEQDLPRIARYCEKDVVTVVQVLRKFTFLPLFTDTQIKFVTE